jgi:hypothetical protein
MNAEPLFIRAHMGKDYIIGYIDIYDMDAG